MRRRGTLLRASLSAVALVAALLPASVAQAQVAIEFLNPSDYTTALQLSDVGDNDAAYHLVAWVKSVPSNPLVEFELQATGENPQTINANRVGSSDTWEAFLQIAEGNTDGPYMLRARLYSAGTEVANDEKTVTINQSNVPPPPAAQTVEITHPANGSPFGFFTPKGKETNGVIVAKASDGAEQVRGFYTQSDPGTDPDWRLCGFGAVNSMGVARIRCTLASGHSPSSISAVAAVANRAPPAPGTEPNPGLDDSGDAHRITPYIQVPSRFSVTPQAQSINPGDCTQPITATLLDQNGQAIAGANVDIHAVGPSDQLRFGIIDNTTSAFDDPDKAHISSEFSLQCSDDSNEGTQGEHNVPGGDDVKHIETVASGGTTNAGAFVFALWADEAGSTIATLFADVDDDDQQGPSEASGGARIGWGQPAPPPVTTVSLLPSAPSPTTGKCQKITLVLAEDGVPLTGRNVDVHATGPADIEFCDAGTGLPRAPDQGGHVTYAHSEGGIHGEAETDGSGHFAFGVTSRTAGDTTLLGWMDRTDDDVQGGDEPAGSGQIHWQRSGQRNITLRASKSSVPKGSRVKLSGRISGDDTCTDAQVVKLKARPKGSRKFKAAGTKTTDSNGAFSFRKKVTRRTSYRAIAPRDGACVTAKSSTVTVNTR